jgi:hypothetical protein
MKNSEEYSQFIESGHNNEDEMHDNYENFDDTEYDYVESENEDEHLTNYNYFSDSSDFETETNEENHKPLNAMDFIFSGSKITVKDYNLYFSWICNKLKLSERKRQFLYKSIKITYPSDNNLPSTFESMKKNIEMKARSSNVISLCDICYCKKIDRNKKNCDNCAKKKINLAKQSNRKIIEAVIYDYENQLKDTIQKNWDLIRAFKDSKFVLVYSA